MSAARISANHVCSFFSASFPSELGLLDPSGRRQFSSFSTLAVFVVRRRFIFVCGLAAFPCITRTFWGDSFCSRVPLFGDRTTESVATRFSRFVVRFFFRATPSRPPSCSTSWPVCPRGVCAFRCDLYCICSRVPSSHVGSRQRPCLLFSFYL